MADLTFAEQVKIILKRKGMTIKALADLIEEKTGKKMSRQNLTQKLGRDNFQEKDMKLISSILGCEYKMDILGNAEESSSNIGQGLAIEIADVINEENSREITVGELADIVEEIVSVEAEAPKEEPTKEAVEESFEEIDPKEITTEETTEEEIIVEEDLTLEESVIEEETAAPQVDVEEVYEDTYEEEPKEEEGLSHEEIEKLLEEEEEAEPGEEAVTETKEEKSKGGIFSVFSRFKGKSTKPTDVKGVEELVPEEPEEPQTKAQEVQEVFEESVTETEHPREEIIQEEEIVIEEPKINPYSGREYDTNSVRMHPTKIGYVQIYSRDTHAWTEITEWAFLGYQERQKALLGKNYKEPTYLD